MPTLGSKLSPSEPIANPQVLSQTMTQDDPLKYSDKILYYLLTQRLLYISANTAELKLYATEKYDSNYAVRHKKYIKFLS